nr:hypothetical protein Iba_chr15fCG4060 [Ipomoea batatas]
MFLLLTIPDNPLQRTPFHGPVRNTSFIPFLMMSCGYPTGSSQSLYSPVPGLFSDFHDDTVVSRPVTKFVPSFMPGNRILEVLASSTRAKRPGSTIFKTTDDVLVRGVSLLATQTTAWKSMDNDILCSGVDLAVIRMVASQF